MQSAGEFFRSAYCFARVFPRATGLMASGENIKLELVRFQRKGNKVQNLPRCEGFGRRDTLIGVDAPSYESEGEAAGGQ